MVIAVGWYNGQGYIAIGKVITIANRRRRWLDTALIDFFSEYNTQCRNPIVREKFYFFLNFVTQLSGNVLAICSFICECLLANEGIITFAYTFTVDAICSGVPSFPIALSNGYINPCISAIAFDGCSPGAHGTKVHFAIWLILCVTRFRPSRHNCSLQPVSLLYRVGRGKLTASGV